MHIIPFPFAGNHVNMELTHFIVLFVGTFIVSASIPGVILIIILVKRQRKSTMKNVTNEPHYEDININYNNTQSVLVHPNDAYVKK